ncbi:MAG: hypothetical protein H6625_13375 [Bdellovibrionaceae bacterium]|nr:hypothetical protein [Pseudobdellovibrionaceae bacterium]
MSLNNSKVVRKLFLVLSLSFSLILSTACTRKSNEEATLVKMNLDPGLSRPTKNSKITLPAGYFPMHMLVNVHFNGQIAIDEWDCNEGKNDTGDISNCAFPTYIDFKGRTFPRGSNRTIQVLLVYANQEERMIFAYDDAVNVEFNNPEISLDIGSAWIQQGGGISGDVGGRHGSLKTGQVEGYFQPPRTGRPAMKLFDRMMFSGWFKVMFFGDAKVSYYHKDLLGVKTPLFVNKTLKDFQQSLTATNAVAAFNIPTFYEVDNHGGTDYESRKSGGEVVVLGFFDSNGVSRLNSSLFSVSRPISAESVDLSFRRLLNGSLLDPINTDSSFLAPDGTPGGNESEWSPYRLQFIPGIDPNQTEPMIQTHGMNSSNATACVGVSDANPVSEKCIRFVPGFVKNRLLIPFEGPFVATMDGNHSTLIKNDSPTAISWKFLPGVAGVAVHGLALFVVDREIEFHNDYLCKDLALRSGVIAVANPRIYSPMTPVVSHKVLVPVTATNGSGSYDFTALANINNQQAIACPFTVVNGLKYFSPAGASNHGFYDNSISSNIATKLSIKNIGPNPFPHLNQNACTPFIIEALDNNNNPGDLPNDPYQINIAQAEGSFYTDENCSSVVSGPYNLNHHTVMLYHKATNIIGDVNIQVSADGGETVQLLASNSINVPVQTVASPVNIIIYAPLEMYTTQCSTVIYSIADSSGVPTAYNNTSVTINLNSTATTGYFYNPGSCGSGSISSTIININQTNSFVEFSGANPELINLTTTNGGSLVNIPLNSVNVVDPGPAEYAILEGPENPSTNICTKFEIVTYKVVHPGLSVRANAPAGINYILANTLGGSSYFYPSSTACNADSGVIGLGSTINYSQTGGTTGKEVWFKSTLGGYTPFSINVSADNPDFSTSKSANIGF